MIARPDLWGPLRSRYETPRPRKLLAIDDGGMRSLISVAILERLERFVGQPLGDYFDYIGGTGTGAVVAACLARGMLTRDISAFFRDAGPSLFSKSALLQRLKSLYSADPLALLLRSLFGDSTLQPEHLRCLLLVVLRNATTDSPWPVSSNPAAKYNDPERPDSNLRIPLWQIVRASTAVPAYFPPEQIQLDPDNPQLRFFFVGGSSTVYANPSFLLYRMATTPAYRLNWPSGEDQLALVSVGAGHAPVNPTANASIPTVLAQTLSSLLQSATVDQDINCRILGRCVYGDPIDREIGDLVESGGPPRLFRYIRYDVDLSAPSLEQLGVKGGQPSAFPIDDVSAENLEALNEIGHAVANHVHPEHLGPFLDS